MRLRTGEFFKLFTHLGFLNPDFTPYICKSGGSIVGNFFLGDNGIENCRFKIFIRRKSAEKRVKNALNPCV